MQISNPGIDKTSFDRGVSDATISFTIDVGADAIGTVEITLSPLPPLKIEGSSVYRKTYNLKAGSQSFTERAEITNGNSAATGGIAYVFLKLRISGSPFSDNATIELKYA